LMAEWQTAGDERVCPLCEPLDGTVMTIEEARGLIPRHPNCRCMWVPANVGEKVDKKRHWTKAQKETQIDKSLKRELPKKTRAGEKVPQTVAEAKRRSSWPGKTLRPKRPPKGVDLGTPSLVKAPPSSYEDVSKYARETADQYYHMNRMHESGIFQKMYDASTDRGKEEILKASAGTVKYLAETKALPFTPSKKALQVFADQLDPRVNFGQDAMRMRLFTHLRYGAEIRPFSYMGSLDDILKRLSMSTADAEDFTKLMELTSTYQREWLKKKGIKKFTAYRGVNLKDAAAVDLAKKAKTLDNTAGAYWSTDRSHAQLYAHGKNAIVAKKEVGVDDVAFYVGGETKELGVEHALVLAEKGKKVRLDDLSIIAQE